MTTYIVSGASSGIGRAICESLLEQGISVVGLVRDPHKFTPDNQNYRAFTIDFSEAAALEANLKQLSQQIDAIDGVICCAGFGHFAELEQFSFAKIQEVMMVNFTSQVLLVKTFLPQLKQQQSGKIILLGSESALQGARKGSIYCASKFALRGFAQSLRQECKSNQIAVSIINPGLVRTPFFDALNFKPGPAPEHALQAEQIAETVNLLLQMDNHSVIEEINMQPLKAQIEKC